MAIQDSVSRCHILTMVTSTNHKTKSPLIITRLLNDMDELKTNMISYKIFLLKIQELYNFFSSNCNLWLDHWHYLPLRIPIIYPILFYGRSLFIYFPTTQLFHSTKIFKNQYAHNQKGYSWSLWCLGGCPVTRISICTYYSTLHSVDHKNPPCNIHKPKSSKSLWICGAWKWENLYSTNFNSTLFIVTTLPFLIETIYLVESESYDE